MQIVTGGRDKFLGGSEMASVLGLNPYESAFDLWLLKTGRAKRRFVENKYTEWGKRKEQVIAQHYADRHNLMLIETPKRAKIDGDFLAGTPDRLLLGSGSDTIKDPITHQTLIRRGLEIKTGLAKHVTKWHESGIINTGYTGPAPVIADFAAAGKNVPLYYWIQCQMYMWLMDFPEWDLAVLLDSSDYREYRILYDAEYTDRAVQRCRDFWRDHIIDGKEPTIDNGKLVNQWLDSQYSEHTEQMRAADATETVMMHRLKDVEEQLRERSAESKALKEQLAELTAHNEMLQRMLQKDYDERDTLVNNLRSRIKRDAGLIADIGAVTWTKPKTGNGTRTLRKKWNDDSCD